MLPGDKVIEIFYSIDEFNNIFDQSIIYIFNIVQSNQKNNMF